MPRRAFVFAAEEDFAVTPVEAQSCGAPIIAYGRGGRWNPSSGAPLRFGVLFNC
jgi:hypothetical protein